MEYTWTKWLKDWRTITENSNQDEYTLITITVGEKNFEVLQVSKFHKKCDGDKAYVETSIREFNDKTAFHSRVTRDLGIVRVITSKNKPAYVIEPGADVFVWTALTQGVSPEMLEKVMRAGDLGRRVRRRDRIALKNSREREEAVCQELSNELIDVRLREKKLLLQLEEMEAELDSEKQVGERMREYIIKQNEEQHHPIETDNVPIRSSLKPNHDYPMNSKIALPGNVGSRR